MQEIACSDQIELAVTIVCRCHVSKIFKVSGPKSELNLSRNPMVFNNSVTMMARVFPSSTSALLPFAVLSISLTCCTDNHLRKGTHALAAWQPTTGLPARHYTPAPDSRSSQAVGFPNITFHAMMELEFGVFEAFSSGKQIQNVDMNMIQSHGFILL